MTPNARRRARPDFPTIRPKHTAPNRNHADVSANPENAVSNLAIPSIQNRKQPRIPETPWSSTCVIQAAIMNRPTASALCACGAMPSGRNQNPTAPAARIASRPAVRRSDATAGGAAVAVRTGATIISNGLTIEADRMVGAAVRGCQARPCVHSGGSYRIPVNATPTTNSLYHGGHQDTEAVTLRS